MAEERFKQYIIPENVSEGGRIKGFRTRNVIEGAILALVGFLFTLCLPLHGTSRVTAVILVCFPLLGLGAIGVDGGPLSDFVKSAIQWLRKRGPILYNMTPRVLEASPLETAMADSALADSVSAKLDNLRKRFQSSEDGLTLVEGEDYEFMPDREEDNLLAEKAKPAEAVFEEEGSFSLQPADAEDVELTTEPPISGPEPERPDTLELQPLEALEDAAGLEDLYQ